MVTNSVPQAQRVKGPSAAMARYALRLAARALAVRALPLARSVATHSATRFSRQALEQTLRDRENRVPSGVVPSYAGAKGPTSWNLTPQIWQVRISFDLHCRVHD